MEAARAELVTQHLGLAQWHARRRSTTVSVRNSEWLLDELTSAAYEGLVAAARDFDPDNAGGATFVTYAGFRIKGAMSDFMRSRRRGYQVRNGIGRNYDGRFPRAECFPRVAHLKHLGKNRNDSSNDDKWSMIASRDPGPEDVALERVTDDQLRGFIRSAIHRWPSAQRRWVEDIILDGRSVKDAATLRGVSEEAYWHLARYAKPRLRALLATWDRVT